MHMRCLRPLLLAAWMAGAALPAAGQGAPRVRLSGVQVVDDTEVLRRIGTPPRARSRRKAWIRWVRRRVEAFYHQRGYTRARLHHRFRADGGVDVHVDEGKLSRVVFVGGSVLDRLMYRVDLYLPHEVFHAPTVERFAEELRHKRGLRNVLYEVEEGRYRRPTPFGGTTPERILTFFVISKEGFGWTVGLELDAVWGLIPSVGLRVGDTLVRGDRLRTKLEAGVPYRRLFFDAEPQFRWIYGALGVDYQLPRFAGRHLAPGVSAETVLARHSRYDIGLDDFLVHQNEAFVSLRLIFGRTTLSLGGGLRHANVFDRAVGESGGPPGGGGVLRAAALVVLETDFTPRIRRRDLRSTLRLRAAWGDWPGEETGLITDVELTAQVAIPIGPHDMVLRGRGVFLHGDVRFWNEPSLTGSYMRVFFGGRYYVRLAAQIDNQIRFALFGPDFKVGLFYDLSVFADRSREVEPLSVAQAVGPSLNFLLLDQIALDMYYGFGFAPVGFSHNLYLSASTAF